MAVKQMRMRAAIRTYTDSDNYALLAPGTRKHHVRVLDALVKVVDPTMYASDLRAEHVDATMAYLRFRGDAAREAANRPFRSEVSLNADRSILRTFVGHLHVMELLASGRNPAAHLRNAKRKTKRHIDSMVMDAAQVKEALEVAGRRHARDRVALALGVFAGLRESEARELRWSGVSFRAGTVTVWRDKQDEIHTVTMSPALRRELRRYLAWLLETLAVEVVEGDWYVCAARPRAELRGGFNGWPLASTPARPVVPTEKAYAGALCHDVQAVLAEAGIKIEKDGFHTLRRTGACMLLEATGDIRKVMHFLGHKSQQTTEIYVQYAPDRAATSEALKGWDPMADLSDDDDLPQTAGNVVPLRRVA